VSEGNGGNNTDDDDDDDPKSDNQLTFNTKAAQFILIMVLIK
jgi:hypothetical protein